MSSLWHPWMSEKGLLKFVFAVLMVNLVVSNPAIHG